MDFDGPELQPVADYGKTKNNWTGLQKTSPNRSKLHKMKILFKPTKTGIFVVFYT